MNTYIKKVVFCCHILSLASHFVQTSKITAKFRKHKYQLIQLYLLAWVGWWCCFSIVSIWKLKFSGEHDDDNNNDNDDNNDAMMTTTADNM